MKRMILIMLILAVSLCRGQTLTHGPFVGGVTNSSARIYIRADQAATLNVQISESSLFTSPILGTPVLTDSTKDYSAIISFSSLRPATLYYYRALVNGVPQGEIRSFTSFPNPGTSSNYTFVFGSCQQSDKLSTFTNPGRGDVFPFMAADHPAFFLQIGDWTYPDTTDAFVLPGYNLTLWTGNYIKNYDSLKSSYRAKYFPQYKLQNLLRVAPIDYMYDDHDFGYNNSSGAEQAVVDTMPIYLGMKAYREFFPGYSLPNSAGGLWHKFTYGNSDIFMLDLRTRRDSNCAPFSPYNKQFFGYHLINVFYILGLPIIPYEFIPKPGHSILAGYPVTGQNQRDWLLSELSRSTAKWKFLVCTVPFNRGYRSVIDTALAMYRRGITMINDPVNGAVPTLAVPIEVSDKMAAFPEDEDSILAVIKRNNISNVIVLSGDLHTAGIDDGTNAGLPEICAGGLDMPNSRSIQLIEGYGIKIWNKGAQDSVLNNYNKAYGRINVFGGDSVQLQIVDDHGTKLFGYTVKAQPASALEPVPQVPRQLELFQNYPNPFNPSTTIDFDIPGDMPVTLSVTDILGRTTVLLSKQMYAAGHHSFIWNAAGFSTGTYFARLTAGTITTTRTMLYIK